MRIIDRILLLLTGLLAAYQIVVGIDGLDSFPIACYTISFGVLLVAGLLLIILGFEILDSPWVVIVSTIIPLSLALGLVWEFLPTWRVAYLVFVLVGFVAIVITRLATQGKSAIFVLAVVHGIAGLTIFFLPLVLSFMKVTGAGFSLVGVGGALIGVGGLLLSFLKAGRPLLSRETILEMLPVTLLLMALAFVAGFALM
jgi:hypothetical protein